jgi:hypothetical protein
MLIHHTSPYRSSYALGGLGAIPGVTCTSTYCKGSSDTATVTKFGPLQAAINAALDTFAQPPAAKLVVDGKIGKNTVTAITALGVSAGQYLIPEPSILQSYGIKPPTFSAVATADPAKIIRELDLYTKQRLREQAAVGEPPATPAQVSAAEQAAAAAEAAKQEAEAIAMVKPGSAEAQAAQAKAEAAQVRADATAAIVKAGSQKAWGFMPSITGKVSTDRAIYGVAALAAVYGLYRYDQGRRGAAPRTASPAVAGLRGLGTPVRGDRLPSALREQVLRSYTYRWTKDNPHRERMWRGIPGAPTIPLISDEQWLREHAFEVTKKGKLSLRSRHAAPALDGTRRRRRGRR